MRCLDRRTDQLFSYDRTPPASSLDCIYEGEAESVFARNCSTTFRCFVGSPIGAAQRLHPKAWAA